ncbi:hypothetical protein BJX64DRAFT_271062 [Aspergillus heterothallicus]
MIHRRLYSLKHIQFKPLKHAPSPSHTWGAAQRHALEKDGHSIWGLVVYRSTYNNDRDWDEFLYRLEHRTHEMLDRRYPAHLVSRFRLSVLEDKAAFDRAMTAGIRSHFQAWTESAVEEEQGAGAQPRNAQRYRFCLQVDEAALQSVLQGPGPGRTRAYDFAGFVRLINKEWEPYDPIVYRCGKYVAEEPQEPLEGCRLQDVGWMKVSYINIVPLFQYLRWLHVWDLEYRRPPAVWAG